MNEIIAGLVALAIPAFLIGSIVLWRTKPVLMMYYALVLVGLGYLTTTGAVEDVGRQALTYVEDAPAPQPVMPAAVAPTAAPVPAPQEAQAASAPATPAAPDAVAPEAGPAAGTEAKDPPQP